MLGADVTALWMLGSGGDGVGAVAVWDPAGDAATNAPARRPRQAAQPAQRRAWPLPPEWRVAPRALARTGTAARKGSGRRPRIVVAEGDAPLGQPNVRVTGLASQVRRGCPGIPFARLRGPDARSRRWGAPPG